MVGDLLPRVSHRLVGAGVAVVVYPLLWILRPMAWVRRQTGIPLHFQLVTAVVLIQWVDYVVVESPRGWLDRVCFVGYSFWLALMVIQVFYALWQRWTGQLPDVFGSQEPGQGESRADGPEDPDGPDGGDVGAATTGERSA
ncbi:hypothetical protein [Gordonia paraffinivorans]|uniref:hypothetical protein n=1 Tax=Gordonia paraffinivorans TaxID=175628 RepID=UPI001E459397|nr:hypothetical protein [Gordonia paraffinivorans]MCD2146777.1 hypothetical protein [Gordonia paraffinivorans]